MAFDRKTSGMDSVQPHAHGHEHVIPHSHATSAGATGGNAPAMSLLRISIIARLASAMVCIGVIWAAVRWAIA